MSNWMQTVMFQTAHSLPEVRSFVQAAIGQTAHALPETSSWVQTVMGQTAHSTADGRDSDHEDAEPHGPSPRSFPDHPDHLLYESVRVLYEAVQGERGELGCAQGATCIAGSRRPPSPRSSATVGPESPSPPRPSKTESSAPEQPEIEPPSDPPHPSSYWQTVLGGRTAPQPTKRGRPPPEQEDDDDGPEPAPKRPCV